ncbi:PLP-dependent aminotransferase family protein [Nordella sp. HKS 07]|uniref:rhizopine catabolism transcriptional regulator MocR n=1 Tax=Nordella sp. HKS 07 TaxID=2712222 RepID=UPI001FEE76CC|nr:PLP-dependent aminotransferase family protein [Nordella sp. HKS 07]
MSNRSHFPFDILTVDKSARLPLHRQLYDTLRSLILSGRLRAGSTLPATRSLAQQLKLGRNTVSAAYERLLTEGYVEARPGRGTWVANLPDRPATPPGAPPVGGRSPISRRGEALATRLQPLRNPNKINFQPGFPEVSNFPFATWAKLLARNARRRSGDLLGYYHFAGHPRLRAAIADYVTISRGVSCTPDRVVVVTGAQAGLDLVARLLLDDGDPVWMEEPGYWGARSALEAAGAALHPLFVDGDGWALDDPTLPEPRLIYVTPACQWPLGTTMRMEERLHLLSRAERHGAWIIEDDYDGEYRFRGQPLPAMQGLDRADRVIYLGTFSKTLFSSLRIGFLIVPDALVEPFNRAVGVTGQFTPLLLQVTLADFIEQGHFATHLKRMRRVYGERQKEFIALCRKHLGSWITVSDNESGMQVIARFTSGMDDVKIVEIGHAHGIDLQPISINYHHKIPEQGLLLGYAALNERDIQTAVMALKASFAEARKRGAF